MAPKPLAIDLFCGYGGWTRGLLAAGFRVVGIDNNPKCAAKYPGEFVLADVQTLDGRRFRGARTIVASPPCTRFSEARASRTRDPPNDADLALVRAAKRIIDEAEPTYWAIENVRGAIRYFRPLLGEPALARRPFYLWGHFPRFLTTSSHIEKKGWVRHPVHGRWIRERGWRDPNLVAMLPISLTGPFAEACLP